MTERPLDLVRDFRRGAIATHVLHHAAEDGVHGAWLTDELARHGYRISPGTLYPLLRRMEDAGLIVGREQVVEGRVLRRYRATRAGRAALTELRSVISELAHEVSVDRARKSTRRPAARPAPGAPRGTRGEHQ